MTFDEQLAALPRWVPFEEEIRKGYFARVADSVTMESYKARGKSVEDCIYGFIEQVMADVDDGNHVPYEKIPVIVKKQEWFLKHVVHSAKYGLLCWIGHHNQLRRNLKDEVYPCIQAAREAWKERRADFESCSHAERLIVETLRELITEVKKLQKVSHDST